MNDKSDTTRSRRTADSVVGVEDQCDGPRDAARRERVIEDSIEAAVAALKRIHQASQMTQGVGEGDAPAGTRSLLYDLIDVNARYVRNMLGVMARANDQVADLFGQSYASPGRLAEKSVEVTLVRENASALGTFRLHNATGAAVSIDFPATAEFFKAKAPTSKVPVNLAFSVRTPTMSGGAAIGTEWYIVGCSTVPPDGILEIAVEAAIDQLDRDAWRADTAIHTNAAHDLGLVFELPA